MILLAEEDPATAGFLTDNLIADGYYLLVADDKAAALQLLETERPDLVLCDVNGDTLHLIDAVRDPTRRHRPRRSRRERSVRRARLRRSTPLRNGTVPLRRVPLRSGPWRKLADDGTDRRALRRVRTAAREDRRGRLRRVPADEGHHTRAPGTRARRAGCDHPECVVPLCWTHHRAYDTGELELLPHLEPQSRAEVAHAVMHLGLIGAVRRLAPRRR